MVATSPKLGRCGAPGCRAALVWHGPRPGSGQRPRYCSLRCRVAAHRARAKAARRRSVEWYTPPEEFAWFAERWGPFDVDPCATPSSPIWPLVPHHLTVAEDGLTTPWPGRRAFCNPPYGRGHLDRWADRAHELVAAGEVEVAALLVPLRPSSAWFRRARERGATSEPLDHRIRFFELRDGELVRTSGALFETTALVFRRAL